MSKSSEIKTNRIERSKYITPTMIADVVGCHPNYVNQVWRGDRRSEQKKGEAIEVATLLLNECVFEGMKKAKEIIGVVQEE